MLRIVLIMMALTPAVHAAEPPPAWQTTGAFAAISARDAPALAQWYKDMLGFTALSEGAAPNGTRFALLRQGDNLIEIVQPPGAASAASAPGALPPGIFKLGYTVGDLDALEGALRSKRARFAHGIVQPTGNPLRSFAVFDAEGNRVQFFGR
jgi:hypothetical protein